MRLLVSGPCKLRSTDDKGCDGLTDGRATRPGREACAPAFALGLRPRWSQWSDFRIRGFFDTALQVLRLVALLNIRLAIRL